MSETEYRIEHDTMGEVKVPKDALYAAQTQRAVENFPISGRTLSPHHIAALGQIKRAAALANAELGVLDEATSKAIVEAAERLIGGEFDDQYPIDIFQTGSGTSSNMNTNEVLGTVATQIKGEKVHPNDHVNASQSSNDVFPSSIHIAAYQAIDEVLLPKLDVLASSLEKKAEEFADVVKAGRTHLMDATPIMLGQEFSGYAAQIRLGIDRVKNALPRLAELPLGGTAVGTGINTPEGFSARVIELIAENTGLPFTEATNHFEAQAAQDSLVETSGALRTVAVSMVKIANDLRWASSGPRSGIGEIQLPDLQPGSSIMPGKVNPVLPEATVMVAAQVIGNDATITFAGAQGNFDLLVMLPVMAADLLESINCLGNVAELLAVRCVDGIIANRERCLELAESSPSIVTPLNRLIGYENAAKIAKHSVKKGITVKEAALDLGYVKDGALTEEQLDAALDVATMTRPSGK
ncbi:class II fumarate hydratase [Nanchangia anserum]|uniref:Fumarate hydratase class II n=1 Tax=Nanchangia anserum TaxID=2692125 RepID=A0A8I0G7B7_9ACTO|nr:class II fumarate hydratase [Nanchangia anserum]MBD3689162.1 class II fumarate hydratase [Nanchangia anserum]QOX81394.1 class II fumarate hydratase [Nanchangia anserum]